MPHLVQINSGKREVLLPNGALLDAGQQSVLTDEEFASIEEADRDELLTDLGDPSGGSSLLDGQVTLAFGNRLLSAPRAVAVSVAGMYGSVVLSLAAGGTVDVRVAAMDNDYNGQAVDITYGAITLTRLLDAAGVPLSSGGASHQWSVPVQSLDDTAAGSGGAISMGWDAHSDADFEGASDTVMQVVNGGLYALDYQFNFAEPA